MPEVTGNNFYIDSHDLHFRTGTTNVASISYDTSDDSISLNTAGTGAINIGDAGGNVFIGDGTSETDIVFEQNGAIRGLTNKTLTLGQTDSNVTIAAQNFTISGTGVVTDMSGRLQVRNIEATDNNSVGWAGTDSQVGTIYMSDESRGLLGNMGGGYARNLINGGSKVITIGSAGTSSITGINYKAGNVFAARGEHNFYTSGNNVRMHIAQDGNVGIGTNNPHTNQQLHIYGAGAGLEFSVDAQYADATRILSYDRNSSAYKPFFLQSSELRIDTNGSRRMTINSAGKVGINETSIDAYLHLSNSAEINQKFERPGASAWRIGIPNGQTYFAFDDTNDNLSSPKVVITKTDGNVGIGSNAPRQELDVSGVIAQSTTTVNSLPSATNNEGARSMVSDSQLSASSNFGATIAGYGGGSYTVPVWCDGAYWYIG